MSLLKISQGILRIGRYAVLTSFFSFACISKTKRCRLKVLQEYPVTQCPLRCQTSLPFQPIPLPIYRFLVIPTLPTKNWIFQCTLIILEIFIINPIPSFKINKFLVKISQLNSQLWKSKTFLFIKPFLSLNISNFYLLFIFYLKMY